MHTADHYPQMYIAKAEWEIQGEKPAASRPTSRTGAEMDAWNSLFQYTFL
jgi:hypothetical protein